MKKFLLVVMSLALVCVLTFAAALTKQDVIDNSLSPINDFVISTSDADAPLMPPELIQDPREVPCIICEPNDIPEGEPVCYNGYVDIYNSGCNNPTGTPPVYTPISCNTSVCGTIGTYAYNNSLRRDTDWYSLTLTEMTHVKWSVASEAIVQALIIDITNGCADVDNHILAYNYTELACDTASVEMTLPAGTYAFFAATYYGSGVPCGAVYRAWLDCDAPCDVCQGNLYEADLPQPMSIPDNGLINPCLADGGISSTINIPTTASMITDVNVNVNITHSWIGDLAIVLEHGGVSVVLKSRALTDLGEDCNNLYTTFDEQGTPWVPGECPHDNGCFQSYDMSNCGNDLLSAFNGMPVAGTWTLYVADGAGIDTGTLDSWGLCITEENPCDAPNPVIVDITEGIPLCQCLEACAGEELTVYFTPLTIDQKPSEIRIDDGCTGDPFRENEMVPGYNCDNMDCPPAYPTWDGNSFYDAAVGGWGIVIIAREDGCFCICLDDILPVELVGFDAVAGDESVSLSWTTASEVNNDRFEILRDAVTMTAIDANNYAAGSHYTWTDNSNLTNGREYSYSLVAVSMDGIRETIGTVNATPAMSAATITEYALHQNYPNPFNPETNIIFDIVEEGNVSLTVYNPLGQTVATLVNGTVQSGRHTVSFDAANLPSGLYYYRLEAGDFSAVKKMILMK
jgi:subtilisin-like proprotein convertase family protein